MLITGKQEKQILAQAREERWAIGAFNVFDMVTAEAVFQAAEALNVPAMIQSWDYHNPTAPEKSMLGEFEAKVFTRLILERAAMSPVPVIIHLDHTPTYEGCIRGIQGGAASVMIDGSQKPIDENIAITKKVVDTAHACGVLVEGEIGHVSGHGGDEGMVYTEVEDAKKYYESTGIDLMAVSIGTIHGIYASEPVLNYDRIAELREAIPIPLVMHGSSGLSEEQFRKAIAAGIVKINFYTYTQVVGGKAIADAVAACGRPMLGALAQAGGDAARDYIMEHMKIFGTKPVTL